VDTTQPEWGQVSSDVKDLLRGLLDVNAATRLTAADALNHTWYVFMIDTQYCSVRGGAGL